MAQSETGKSATEKAAAQAGAVRQVCAQHSGVVATLSGIQGALERIENRMDTMVNRLPVWGTIVLAMLTALVGASVGIACAIAKNGGS